MMGGVFFIYRQVQTLYRYCPQENAAGVFCLDSRAQDAVIALGLYFLESGCQHEQQIIPYLLRLAKSLPKAVWVDDCQPSKTDSKYCINIDGVERLRNFKLSFLITEVPATERFSFCLNTLLSDIAVNCPDVREEVMLNQVDTLNVLTNMIKTSRESNALPPMILCKATVPILFGLTRSMGRYAQTNPPLLCRLFPRLEMPVVQPMEQQQNQPMAYERHSSLNQFRCILPRSLSGGLNVDDTKEKKKRASLHTFYSVPYDATTYFFAKYGSSFNQFPNMRFYGTPQKHSDIQFAMQHLQTIFSIAKKLLTKEILDHLDEQADDVFLLHQIRLFGYKSFSETLNLVLVTLLRELLQNQRDLPTPFTKDVQEFVKRLFLIGQTELQSKQHDHEKERRSESFNTVNKYKINVMANAACVDLLVWAIADETGKLSKNHFWFSSSVSMSIEHFASCQLLGHLVFLYEKSNLSKVNFFW